MARSRRPARCDPRSSMIVVVVEGWTSTFCRGATSGSGSRPTSAIVLVFAAFFFRFLRHAVGLVRRSPAAPCRASPSQLFGEPTGSPSARHASKPPSTSPASRRELDEAAGGEDGEYPCVADENRCARSSSSRLRRSVDATRPLEHRARHVIGAARSLRSRSRASCDRMLDGSGRRRVACLGQRRVAAGSRRAACGEPSSASGSVHDRNRYGRAAAYRR